MNKFKNDSETRELLALKEIEVIESEVKDPKNFRKNKYAEEALSAVKVRENDNGS